MKRTMAALACAATAALIAPAVAVPAHAQTFAQAQARAGDPVSALRKQFVTGHGVRFASSGKLSVAGSAIKYTAKGAFAFGRAGVGASNVTQKVNYGALLGNSESMKGLNDPTRMIVIGRTGYISGGIYASLLPEGKTWLRVPNTSPDAVLQALGGFVNPTDWRNLKTVLASTKAKGAGGVVNGAKTTLYQGTITLKQLAQATPSLKRGIASLGGDAGKVVVNWKVWVGSDQLVRRVSTSTDIKMKVEKSSIVFTVTDTTAYTGWGTKVSVKAPPKAQVANMSDIDGTVPDVPGTINLGD
ncbi:hypothetical protein JOL79_13260 [Microbispora sp. RL4-1S]|uniref:LppX_LprAFG lipoprotein n=1 Tax=Microbispora oryzae TaxID=2806554 RepID=A0A940WK63_9ACTN|nr:hypothetical protein [Microbispora oryzae]MBP2704782.1 hypothetical protein [Microbispora oryzae]